MDQTARIRDMLDLLNQQAAIIEGFSYGQVQLDWSGSDVALQINKIGCRKPRRPAATVAGMD